MPYLDPDEHYAIEAAIRVGDIAYARELVREAIKHSPPDADLWYLAALVAGAPQQETIYLEKALALNPAHEQARLALEEKSRNKTVPRAQTLRDRLQQKLAQRR